MRSERPKCRTSLRFERISTRSFLRPASCFVFLLLWTRQALSWRYQTGRPSMCQQKTWLFGSEPPQSGSLWKCWCDFCRLPRVQGGQECTLSGTAQLTATTHRQAWARPPIDVDFQVLMFTASGLLVRFLKVFEKSNYHSVKWVRYLTKANGGYQIRVSSSECLFFLSDWQTTLTSFKSLSYLSFVGPCTLHHTRRLSW